MTNDWELETTEPPKKRSWGWVVWSMLFVLAVALIFYVNQTDQIPEIVDAVRNLPFVGPERMAQMEDAFYAAQDQWARFVYEHTHSPTIIVRASIGAQTSQGKTPSNGDKNRSANQTTGAPASSCLSNGSTSTLENGVPVSFSPIIFSDAQPGEGEWTSANMPLGDQPNPPLWHTFYRPDVDRPYARVDLVRIDTKRTRLTLVPGTTEPRATDGTPGLGQIPPTVQTSGKLLAAWNGGFLTIHGAYGMMVDRRLILPARDGMAVLAQYADGSIKIGVWGQTITMTQNLVSFRQNGPILVDRGVVNNNALLAWGKSVSGNSYIWRSGIGLTPDGALIVGVGNSLSADKLGEALVCAGAVQAMQLDVNAWHVFFFSYTLGSAGLVPTKLNPAMPGNAQTYLKPFDRDFMYLTLK